MRYRVKSSAGAETYMEILRKNGEGYDILITSVTEKSVKEIREYITSDLFDSCIRTGYLEPCEEPAAAHSA